MSRKAAIVLVGLAAAAPTALGHAVAPGHAHHAEAHAATPFLLVAAVLAAVFGLRRASPHRLVALGLVALLSVATFEVALHSVHHLDEPDAGASCSVLAATAELHGASAPSIDVGQREQPPEYLVGVRPVPPLPVRSVRVPEGRAPPVPRSA